VGFNARKPAVETQERWMKIYQAARAQARTVILGSSRTDLGLDPTSSAWPQAMRPVFNLSFLGASLTPSLVALRVMVDRTPPAERPHWVVVGLDFESFLSPPGVPAPARSAPTVNEMSERVAALDGVDRTPWPAKRIVQDYALASLTLDATVASLDTLVSNRGSGGYDLKPTGMYSDAKMREWTRSDGAAALFAQKNEMMERELGNPKQVLRGTPGGPIAGMDALDALFDLARRNGIALILMIQPPHASYLDRLDDMGYWPDYERWKLALVRHASRAKAEGIDVTLWDFGGYEAYAREPVPPAGDRSREMQWYWDPLHYKSRFGEQMIDAAMGRPTLFPADVRLTPGNVEFRLAEVRRERDEYRSRSASLATGVVQAP
ncbi:MAG: hypothetical protein KGJ30_11165, partial [Burkholderiales bacterium]|nr:hypothetical protein [Burkholderiales bacterium]